MSEREDRISRAINAHTSVRQDLQDGKIILSSPQTEILHRLYLPKLGSFDASAESRNAIALHKAISPKTGENLVPPVPDDLELKLRKRWYGGGDHNLLTEMLSQGRLPLGWREYWTPDDPPTLEFALKQAQARGFSVPEKFLTEKIDSSYTEKEAFHAAYCFVSGQPSVYSTSVFEKELRKKIFGWRSNLCQFTGQFIIPDPLQTTKTPYFADQLWILLLPEERRVRLIVLEIDGEQLLETERAKKDHRRDVMLAAMGYEVFHVAGWWCRIDPYRVIAEFLRASGICEIAPDYLTGAGKKIGDYRCDICGELMVRWDYGDIAEAVFHDKLYVGHKFCIEERLDNF